MPIPTHIELQARPDVKLLLRQAGYSFPIECDHAGTGGVVVALAAYVMQLEARIAELEAKGSTPK